MSQDEGENVLIFMFLFLTTKEKVLIEFRSSLWLFLFERRKVMLVAIKIIMMRVTTLGFVQDLKNLAVFEIFKLEFFLYVRNFECSKFVVYIRSKYIFVQYSKLWNPDISIFFIF